MTPSELVKCVKQLALVVAFFGVWAYFVVLEALECVGFFGGNPLDCHAVAALVFIFQ